MSSPTTVAPGEGEQADDGLSNFIVVLAVMSGVLFAIIIGIGLCCRRLRRRTSEKGRKDANEAFEKAEEKRKKKEKEKRIAEEKARLEKEDPFFDERLSDVDSDFEEQQAEREKIEQELAKKAMEEPLLGVGKRQVDEDSDDDFDAEEEFLRRIEENEMAHAKAMAEHQASIPIVPQENLRSVVKAKSVRHNLRKAYPKDYVHPLEQNLMINKKLYEEMGQETEEERLEREKWLQGDKTKRPPPPLLPYIPQEKVESRSRPLFGLRQLTNSVGEPVHDGFHRLHGESLETRRVNEVHPADFGPSGMLDTIRGGGGKDPFL